MQTEYTIDDVPFPRTHFPVDKAHYRNLLKNERAFKNQEKVHLVERLNDIGRVKYEKIVAMMEENRLSDMMK